MPLKLNGRDNTAVATPNHMYILRKSIKIKMLPLSHEFRTKSKIYNGNGAERNKTKTLYNYLKKSMVLSHISDSIALE